MLYLLDVSDMFGYYLHTLSVTSTCTSYIVIYSNDAYSATLTLSLFFFNATATTEIYTESLVGSLRCV